MQDFIRLFNDKQYFDAHEHLEQIWIGLEEPEKSWTQGLIQIAALMHLLEQGRFIGATKVWARAKANLTGAPEIYKDINIINLKKTIANICENLDENSYTDVKIGLNPK
ncbi:MAG: DUF309 domain-containing protein [Candidatus Melainabacteria bacterium]|mgnify:FL=1|nr:DUF309 domain-containing protein [Candidatus Melainabacteria bacterium]